MASGDMAIVNVRILDKNDTLEPTADNEVHFEIEGGKFIGTGNGNPADHSSEKVPVRRTFNGLCQVLVKSYGKKIIITAKSNGLISGSCKIN